MRAFAILAFLTGIASADVEVDVVTVRDPEGKIDFGTVQGALRMLKEPASGWCNAKADMLAWVVFDAGKTTVDTGGSGDRKTELCIAKLLRRIADAEEARRRRGSDRCRAVCSQPGRHLRAASPEGGQRQR